MDTIKSVTTARAAGDFNEQLRLLLVGQKEIDAGDLKPLYQRRFNMPLDQIGKKLKSLLQEAEATGACRLEMRKSSLWILRAERERSPLQSTTPVGSPKSSNNTATTTRSNGTSADMIKSVKTARAARDFNEQLRLLLTDQKEIIAGDLKTLYQRKFDMPLDRNGKKQAN